MLCLCGRLNEKKTRFTFNPLVISIITMVLLHFLAPISELIAYP